MDSSGTDFHDWEILHDHDDSFSQFPDSTSRSFGLIEGLPVSASIIRFDYFSLRNHETYANPALDSTVIDECLTDTENLTSNDFGSEKRDSPSELTSESGDDFLDEDEANKSDALRFEEITSDAHNLERREFDDNILSGFDARGQPDSAKEINSPVDSQELSEPESQEEILDKFYSQSSGNESVTMKSGDDSVNNSNEEFGAEEGYSSENLSAAIEKVKIEAKSGEVEAKRNVVWWKVPVEVLKYCFLRAGPVWSFSVAAAFMGIVILGRRLYKMKRKSKSIQLKITVDDKVSQYASQAARLNEALLVVRRVPVVLTARGANSWPAMNMNLR